MALSPRLPVFTSLRGYRASWLRGDVIAGLTVWAVLVPEALVAGNQGRFAALTATLAITTGILALAAGLLRLGFLARLVIARDVGQVRDVLAQSGGAAAPEYFPSVRAAVDAVRADPAGQVAGATSTVKET